MLDLLEVNASRYERVPLSASLRRVLFKDVVAEFNDPQFPTASMDGYALKHEDLKNEILTVLGDNPAGHEEKRVVNFGESIKTFTGSMMPEGTDTYNGTINGATWSTVSNEDLSLPVTLSSFTGKTTTSGVLLEWETSAEIENAGFVIRRQEAGDRRQEEILATYMSDDALRGHGSTTEAHAYTYTDHAVEPGVTYIYTLSDVDFAGKETDHEAIEVRVESGNAVIADAYSLRPVYPNPFNASFTIPFTLNESMPVTISLYNVNGVKVLNILNNELAAGEYSYRINADELSSGVYFVKTQLTNIAHTQKIVLMK